MSKRFSHDMMIDALKAIGYEVKEETEMTTDRFTEEEVPSKVWNVYRNGEVLCAWGSTGMYRVEWIFEIELQKRLLELFKQL